MSRKIVRVLGIARGSVEFDDGDKWEGGFFDGKPGGYGTHTFANGRVYEGGWEDGKPCGFGKMTYADGKHCGCGLPTCVPEYYEGEWQNGRWHGNGTLTSRSGGQYKGEFANGRANGWGKVTYGDGNVYEGEWANDKRCGRGKWTFANGNVYEGEWLNGKHGNGILKKANGDEFKEEYKHGELLSSKRVATLINGPPSQRPRTRNAVNDIFMLNEDYTSCDICMERFTFDRNTEDEDAKKRLPVLSKTCDHWCCHGCILKEQTRRAGLAEDGASPTWIPCMKCRKADEFCQSEPRYDRRLIDMLSSSIPVREEQPGDEGSTIVERDD